MDCIIVYCTIYIEDFSTWIFIPTNRIIWIWWILSKWDAAEYSQHNFDLQINLKRGSKDKLMEANMVFLLEFRIHYPRVGAANEWWSWLGSLGTAHLHKFLQTINYPSHNLSLIYLLGKLPDLVNETNQFPHTRTSSQNNFESSKYFSMSPQSTSRFSHLDDDDDDDDDDDGDDHGFHIKVYKSFWSTSLIWCIRCSTSATQCTTMTGSWTGWTSTALFVGREPCLISRPSPATTPRMPSPARSPPACTDPWSSGRSQTPTTKYLRW